jgi:uncharacterized protein
MKTATLLLAAAVIVSSVTASPNDITGSWKGTLDAGAVKLRIVFNITGAQGGALTATMDSPDQGATGILVDSVVVKGRIVRLEVKVAHGAYEGTLDEPGTKMVGKWQQGPSVLPMTLELDRSAVQGKETASGSLSGIEPRARQFVTLLAKGDFQHAFDCFDTTMKAALPTDKLKEAWANVLKDAGAFQTMGAARTETFQQFRIVYVACRMQKKPITAKVVFDKADKVAGLFFLPEEAAGYKSPDYVKPKLFQDREVTVGEGQWKLPASLSMPLGKGPWPAVILVHGSGPCDRDETVGANKPFRDLAWGLASQGIAVLRYEKRTKQYRTTYAASIEGLTVKEESVDDALAAVSLVRKTEGIDPDRVFVLGHSLGGMLVPRIGAAGSDIAGFIVMAGCTRPLEDIVLEQTIYQTSLTGTPSANATARVEEVKCQVAAIKGLSKGADTKGLLLNAPASYWLDLQGYAPATAARELKRPMLILQGQNDCQTNPKADFEAWRQALADRKDVTFKSYPALNHLFVMAEGKSTGAEYELPGHVAQNVVDDIAAFVKQH